jgi:hypothetical protein
MNDKIIALKQYMERHHDRLTLDINKAQSLTDKEYYRGAQVATELFISLLTDIINNE